MRRTSALLLASALLLTGCGGGDDTAESSGNGSGSSSTGGSSGGDEPTSNESGDGSEQPDFAMNSLPDDFPEDDIALAEGQIVQALAVPGDNGGFSVTLKVGSFQDAFDEAIDKLEDSGFTVKRRDKLGEFDAAQLESSDYLVVVSGGEASGQAALTYAVTSTQ
jgi:Ca-activated chloride channel homolog